MTTEGQKAPWPTCVSAPRLRVHQQGTKFQLCKVEKVLEMDGDDGCITVSVNLMPLNCALKNN